MEKMDIGLNPETQYVTLKVQKEIFDTVKNFLGDNVLWTYDEEKKEIIIFKKPESYTQALIEIGSKIWENVDTDAYISQERDSWEDYNRK
ncbi:hypothetical protein Calkr_2291 [Caldicellulosiruptor acetigenus I77R1B]|jgi:hypothetical protein|uniref:Uncharacterized protein n=2 Tax=Caldicellulosiruptor acetigenus TaxID=301953 RepID=G2PVV0_9FIRM|nr:hypothetical protein [Caldicellulosiruptor acetigenus]ADQ41745.1 hypothetical protein Calkr_2291 [Caldicellulosiruptor acetigenus I77R1B]AEM72844.1 hypothetical protein Calla_0159 [Caldicellulosiruptor acetigenus 6A]